jgi:hypothetical protein
MDKILYRIKTKPGYKWLMLLVMLFIAWYILKATDPLNPVYSEKANLVCEVVNNGVAYDVVIPASKHPTYIGEEDVFAWNGGYSHNCWIEKK